MPNLPAAQAAFEAYDDATGNDSRSEDEVLTDLITDLLHLAKENIFNKDPEEIAGSAVMNYNSETEDPEDDEEEAESCSPS